MYVFYPADELLRIYENPIRESVSLTVNDAAVNAGYDKTGQQRQQSRIVVANDDVYKRKKEKRRDTSRTTFRKQIYAVRNGNDGNGELKGRREEHHAGTMQNNRTAGEEAANPLKDLTHPNHNEPLKQHNENTFKVIQMGKSRLRFCARDQEKSSS